MRESRMNILRVYGLGRVRPGLELLGGLSAAQRASGHMFLCFAGIEAMNPRREPGCKQ